MTKIIISISDLSGPEWHFWSCSNVYLIWLWECQGSCWRFMRSAPHLPASPLSVLEGVWHIILLLVYWSASVWYWTANNLHVRDKCNNFYTTQKLIALVNGLLLLKTIAHLRSDLCTPYSTCQLESELSVNVTLFFFFLNEFSVKSFASR